jgi:hypothetical protein
VSLELHVDIFAGADIETTCKEAIELATKLNLIVTFNFNGVTVMAKPNVTPSKLVERWREELTRDSPYKIACVHD